MQIVFEKSRNSYTFRDALNLPDNHTFTEAELEAMKQARFEAWYLFVTTPNEE